MKIHGNHLKVNSNTAGKTQISLNQDYINADNIPHPTEKRTKTPYKSIHAVTD